MVTNAVRHGGHDEPVEVHASWNSEVRVEVTDHGDGFTPRRAPARSTSPAGSACSWSAGSRTSWGVETNDGTRVWFVLHRD